MVYFCQQQKRKLHNKLIFSTESQGKKLREKGGAVFCFSFYFACITGRNGGGFFWLEKKNVDTFALHHRHPERLTKFGEKILFVKSLKRR